MKNLIIYSLLAIFLLASVSAACNLDVVLVNQDPYPAMASEYVKVIFQVSGLTSPDCGTVEFWLEENFPFSIDPGIENKVIMKSGTYVKDYQNFFLVPYELRVNQDAFDGENEVTIKYSVSGGTQERIYTEKFNITVADSRTDFEIHVKDYSYITKELTLEILNVGENNVEALTIEVPQQDLIKIMGTNRIILGDLNANEEDTATFESEIQEGDLNLNIYYTDQIGVRRNLEKKVHFNPVYFENNVTKKSAISSTWAFILGLLIPILFFIIRGKIRKRKEAKKRRELLKKR